ncbi:unnamed protein product [Amoebophrya sp. A25]|nr:unnamed protein product [Amoebophrya sp. A25]|eukprot:GSA25T00012287001.1
MTLLRWSRTAISGALTYCTMTLPRFYNKQEMIAHFRSVERNWCQSSYAVKETEPRRLFFQGDKKIQATTHRQNLSCVRERLRTRRQRHQVHLLFQLGLQPSQEHQVPHKPHVRHNRGGGIWISSQRWQLRLRKVGSECWVSFCSVAFRSSPYASRWMT